MYEPVLFGGGPQSRRSSISAPVVRSNSQSPHIILSCVTSVTSRLSLSSPAKYRATTSPTFISCSFMPAECYISSVDIYIYRRFVTSENQRPHRFLGLSLPSERQ